MSDDSEIQYRSFRITLVATQGGVTARIRRMDGDSFTIARSTHTATATPAIPTKQKALDSAKEIVDRIHR